MKALSRPAQLQIWTYRQLQSLSHIQLSAVNRTEAASSNYAAGVSTARGISAGAGDDQVINKGLVTVEAGSTVKVSTLIVSSDGPAYSDAETLALAYAKGIDGGAGNDGILNTDTVFVKAAPKISSATKTFGGNVDGKVGIVFNAAATGITGERETTPSEMRAMSWLSSALRLPYPAFLKTQ